MIKKPEAISLKSHPKLNEKWVQEQVAAAPMLLGMASVFVHVMQFRGAI